MAGQLAETIVSYRLRNKYFYSRHTDWSHHHSQSPVSRQPKGLFSWAHPEQFLVTS